MKNLEQWARHKFLHYSYQREGMTLDWRYLSGPRKLAWIGELVDVWDTVLTELRNELQMPKNNSKPMASYDRGFMDGESHENSALLFKLDRLEQEIKSQYLDLKDKYTK